MRRKNLGNRIVKKAITWAMIVMMSFSGAMSGFASMTVYAEGTTDNVINTYEDELGLCEDFVGAEGKEYHNNEAEKVAEESQSVSDMNEQVAIAEQAVDDAADELEKLENEINNAKTEMGNAQAAADSAEKADEAAKDAADSATKAVDALPSDPASRVDEYNDRVETDQQAVDGFDKIQEDGQVIVGTVTDKDGTISGVTLNDYVDIQVEDAQAAAEDAKKKLAEALAIETDKVTDEVIGKVEEVKAAADKAADAYKKAEDACSKAEAERKAAIEEYNLYAMAYGLPKYGETEITYTDDEAKKAVEAKGLQYQAALQKEIKAIEDATLKEQKEIIEAAQQTAEEAATAAKDAATAASEAKTAAENAEKAIIALDKQADEAAGNVNDYYEDALQTTNDRIDIKNNEINGEGGLQDTYNDAVNNARTDGENTYQTELGSRLNAMNSAKEKYDKASVIDKISCLLAYEDAKRKYNEYNTAEKRNDVINKAVNDSQEVKDASNKLAEANNELTALNKQKLEEEAALEAAKNTRDQYISEAKAVYENESKEKFINDINAILEKYSDEINQIDYDEDLNDWANGVLNSWHIGDKKDVRKKMDDKYSEDELKKIFNKLAITQWAVSTDEVKEAMDEIRTAYRACIEDYYEKMATAEANWAAMDTEAAMNTASEEMKGFAPVIDSITKAHDAVGDAQKRIETAQETYDQAEKKLNDLKKSVENSQFDSIRLSSLQEKIANAKAAVEAAKEELRKAETAKNTAQNYAAWANALMTEHYTRSYAQALVDENGNALLDENGKKQFSFANGKEFDMTDEGVVGRDPKYFIEVSKGDASTQVVPYSVYRAYVDAMYEQYTLEQARSGKGAGKGISIGTIDENNKYTDGSMSVLYWIIDENNKLTGDYLTEDELVDGEVYFVGYAFKQHTDGYHIDGVLFKYSAPEETTPDPTPDDIPDPTPDITPDVTPDDGGETTVIIPDEPVALAAAPVDNAPADDAAVLGARRVDGNTTDAAVLGAKRGTEQAVLGKRRKPQTGDTAALNAWMAAMTMAAGAAGISGTKLAKGKKKEEKED